MTLLRMDNLLLVVDDLEGAIAFFSDLGLELVGRTTVGGELVDRLVGLDGVRGEIALMQTPDGHGRLELDKFHTPPAVRAEPEDAPVNALGIRRIMFAVDDIEGVLSRLKSHGAELIGEVVRYENQFRLCYLRGPEGIIIALSEPLAWPPDRRGGGPGRAALLGPVGRGTAVPSAAFLEPKPAKTGQPLPDLEL